jgi:ubiquinone/menaquinone biosynthesis C-methylase UbiE
LTNIKGLVGRRVVAQSDYLLAGGSAELERLQLQARVWEPETERWLDQIGIEEGWRCLDMGCGAMGILGPLSRRVGRTGVVIGIDRDEQQLRAAHDYVADGSLSNVEVVEGDAYNTGLSPASFDLVHARFLFAPAGRDDALLIEMDRLLKPGGIIAIQEPDSAPWSCYPESPNWNRLKAAILGAFKSGGGDFNVGRRTFQMVSR